MAAMRYAYVGHHVTARTRLWAFARIIVGTLLTGLGLAAALVLLVVWAAQALR